jgi:hypothetical protein
VSDSLLSMSPAGGSPILHSRAAVALRVSLWALVSKPEWWAAQSQPWGARVLGEDEGDTRFLLGLEPRPQIWHVYLRPLNQEVGQTSGASCLPAGHQGG